MSGAGMVRRSLEVRFVTPAFLGGADQRGQWRVPPFKALLRACYRVVVAREVGYDWSEVRAREAALLGHAWWRQDRNAAGERVHARRSQVELALDRWRDGKAYAISAEPTVGHPEVTFSVGAFLYLGYGPLQYDKKARRAKLDHQRAIAAGETAVLRMRYPEARREHVEKALELAHLLGTVGGRSRNGWGSLEFRKDGEPLVAVDREDAWRRALEPYSRRLEECLHLDWPHAVGRDKAGLLLWWTDEFDTWEDVMGCLAEVKIAFRTQFHFRQKHRGRGGSKVKVYDREVLAYPVTHHEVPGWGKNRRLANSLRFKVIRTRSGSYRGLAVHLPCGLPGHLRKSFKGIGTLPNELAVWNKVHAVLDSRMHRVAGGGAR